MEFFLPFLQDQAIPFERLLLKYSFDIRNLLSVHRGASLLYRYGLLLLTATSGYLGFSIGFFLLLLRLSSIESFGIPYTQYAYFTSQKKTKDTFFRDSWSRLRALPVFPVSSKRKPS